MASLRSASTDWRVELIASNAAEDSKPSMRKKVVSEELSQR
jgi:hypothetical protein